MVWLQKAAPHKMINKHWFTLLESFTVPTGIVTFLDCSADFQIILSTHLLYFVGGSRLLSFLQRQCAMFHQPVLCLVVDHVTSQIPWSMSQINKMAGGVVWSCGTGSAMYCSVFVLFLVSCLLHCTIEFAVSYWSKHGTKWISLIVKKWRLVCNLSFLWGGWCIQAILLFSIPLRCLLFCSGSLFVDLFQFFWSSTSFDSQMWLPLLAVA